MEYLEEDLCPPKSKKRWENAANQYGRHDPIQDTRPDKTRTTTQTPPTKSESPPTRDTPTHTPVAPDWSRGQITLPPTRPPLMQGRSGLEALGSLGLNLALTIVMRDRTDRACECMT